MHSRISTRARPSASSSGQAAGGGYDTYGRLLAPFLTQFLPGQPAVTVQNMPGAGSILMANYLYSQAPRDGTVIALGGGSIAPAALFGATGARFDSRRFSWIGSMNSEKGVAVAWHSAPIKKAPDLFEREFVVGGAGVNADSVIFPNAVNRVLSTRFKVVLGLSGQRRDGARDGARRSAGHRQLALLVDPRQST